MTVDFDVSGLSQSRSFHGGIVFSTDSERLPKVRVPVRATYKAPAEVRPSSVVVSSDERGEAVRNIRVVTSRPARILAARWRTAEGARAEFDIGRPASEHVVRVYLPSCRQAPLDGELEFDLELSLGGGKRVSRSVRVPVHRFAEEV